MRIFHGFENLPDFVHPAVTVGSFDGVHCGHRALLGRLLEEARSNGGESIVLTFEPHPRVTLHTDEGLRLLTTFEEKCALLEAAEVDNLVVIPFDREFSSLSGRDFIEGYLIGRLGAEVLVAGYIRVSSTAIRRLLDEGDRAAAERLAGHPLPAHAAPAHETENRN